MLAQAAIIAVSSGLGYLLPAIIGLESMGVPSPGETALVLAAVLASQGKLNIWLVIVIGIASAILGDNIGYALGRRLGRDVLEAPGPFHHRRVTMIDAGDRFFARHGAKTVFIGRWIALIRFATAWLAGINDMRFRTFFLWNAFGADHLGAHVRAARLLRRQRRHPRFGERRHRGRDRAGAADRRRRCRAQVARAEGGARAGVRTT